MLSVELSEYIACHRSSNSDRVAAILVPYMGRVFAAADIGSNTVHLLVAETDGARLTRLDNRSEWIALGETVARHGFIPKAEEDNLVSALKSFRRMARSLGAEYVYLFATEAMRAATNHDEILDRVRESTDMFVDIITPRREAELSLRGVQLDAPAQMDLLLEIGGGSAQVARIEKGHLDSSASAPVGTGRVIAESGLQSPCSPRAYTAAREYVHRHLEALTIGGPTAHCAVASGGVIRGIWRALHPDGDRILHTAEIDYLLWVSSRQTVSRLSRRFSVKNKRAGTLLPGAIVYRELMARFNVEELHVSEYGVREGAIIEIARGEIQGCLV